MLKEIWKWIITTGIVLMNVSIMPYIGRNVVYASEPETEILSEEMQNGKTLIGNGDMQDVDFISTEQEEDIETYADTISDRESELGTYIPYESAKYCLYYEVKDEGIYICGIGDYESKEDLGELVIPDKINDMPVKAIGDMAFWECSGFAGDLVIPSTVTSIGNSAFQGCSGFTGNLTIPSSVTSIGSYAFEGCSSFDGSLTISDSMTEISSSTFKDCSGITGNLAIPDSITLIGSSAFEGCSGFAGELIIPDSVTEIGANAFSHCSGFTGSLTIPSGVTSIHSGTFWECSGFDGELKIPDNVTQIGVAAFSGCKGLTGDLMIPSSVTEIGERAFMDCSGFNGSLTIPSYMKNIDFATFMGCSGLTGGLVIPEGVIKIGQSSFSGCSGFTGNLTIPSGVAEIDADAFRGCSGFTGDLIIPDSVTEISYGVFANCSGLNGSLTIPSSVTIIEPSAFHGCSGLSGDLTIPYGVTSIGEGAFVRCSGFTGNLTIPSSVTSIGKQAFIDCNGFDGSLTIPSSVTLIGEAAFSGCSGFGGKLIIPEETAKIEMEAFCRCSGLTEVALNAQSVGDRAFLGCLDLQNVEIGPKVKRIGREVFAGGCPTQVISFLGADTVISSLGGNKFLRGYRGSTAETYAKENGDVFIPIDDINQTMTAYIMGIDTDVTVSMTEEEQESFALQVAADEGITVEDGKAVSVEIVVGNAENLLLPQNRQRIDQYASANGLVVGQYWDIAMNLQVVNGERKQIEQTAAPVRLVLEVPKNLRLDGRVFSVLRLHRGNFVLLNDLDDNPDTVTIETDSFSSYTIVYSESGGNSILYGNVVSSGSESVEASVKLLDKDGEIIAETMVTGRDTEYRLSNIETGNYTLRVSKMNHVTREYPVTVADELVEVRAEIRLIGDVNGDGKIDAKDKRIIYNHIAGNELIGYEFLVGDVNSSGKIDARDKRMIYNHIAATDLLWQNRGIMRLQHLFSVLE